MAKKKSAKLAIFVGRFQPFHKGHEKILRRLLEKYPQVVVGIGSRKKRRTMDNPFSSSERKMLIAKTLAGMKDGAGKKVGFAYLDDFAKDEDWAKSVKRKFSADEFVAYSGNALVLRLLKNEGFETRKIRLLSRKKWEGKIIRKKIREGNGWKNDLPQEIRGWMEKKGVRIINACAKPKRMA